MTNEEKLNKQLRITMLALGRIQGKTFDLVYMIEEADVDKRNAFDDLVDWITKTSASHFGKKSTVDGYKFDSQKELDFYLRYIKNSGYEFEVQKNLVLVDKFPLGSHNVRSVSYKADFVVLDGDRIKHVYDVKNGFNSYAIDDKSQLKFKLVAQRYHVPVEVVVLRKNDFRVSVLGTTKKIETQVKTNIDYDYSELIG